MEEAHASGRRRLGRNLCATGDYVAYSPNRRLPDAINRIVHLPPTPPLKLRRRGLLKIDVLAGRLFPVTFIYLLFIVHYYLLVVYI